jgi:hypothetical protein
MPIKACSNFVKYFSTLRALSRLKKAVAEWIKFSNAERIHSALEYRSRAEAG